MGDLIVWWLLIEALGLIGFPLAARLFSARVDYGYAFAKIITVLVVSYLAWILGSAGVSYPVALGVAAVGFLLLNGFLALQGRATLASWLRGSGLRTMLILDGLWTFGFLFFAWQRSLSPEIFGAEKYMDFSFFNALSRTSILPPQDPWMSGEIFNYYYFGYLMLANLARLAPIANHISDNLCVVTVAGLAFGQFAAIGWMLTRRWAFAAFAGVVAMLIGNLDGLLQLLEKGGFTPFDYWRSTRVVGQGDTINEFPYFTVIHGDLHPHYIVLPVAVLMLALLLDPARVRSGEAPEPWKGWSGLWSYVPLTFVLASMIVISPWELPVAAMVTFLLLNRGLPLLPLISWPRLRVGAAVIVMLVVGYVLYLPFYAHFHAPQGGVGFKVARTSLLEFLTVFGFLLLPPAIYLGSTVTAKIPWKKEYRDLLIAVIVLVTLFAYGAGNAVFVVLLALGAAALIGGYATDDLEQRAPLLLVLAACLALLACELVYIKDPYGEKLYRMNTVFKLYFQSWILLSIAVPWCCARLVEGSGVPAGARRFGLAAIAAVFVASCAYPAGITATRLEHRFAPRSLDGTEYLQREHPDDFAAIKWVRENVTGLPVILEASGNPYSYYARFSSNTGLPTVMGWANHEGLWRDHVREVEQRKADVARIYNAPALDEVAALLDRYHVTYIVVGELERKDYQAVGLQKFESLKPVFTSGDTTVYAWR
jgi:YYY domain-containing protein